MYLKCLDIHGFKTFAQRTTFVFPQGVTAIVGANGSGKSNIVDAVRWVLGEQSFAQLRCKRTEDLIFSGGKGRAPLGFADVSLSIDNSDRLLPFAFDEVTIGRRAYRSGENEYYINRSRVRLRDLLEAVAPLGSSFTLINQGLVDAALSLQAEDRHRLFEEAAELAPYQARKAEAERRLRETETNLVRLDDLLQEQEPQLRALKRQARDAEVVATLQAELDLLLHQQYRSLSGTVRVELERAGSAEQALRAALTGARRAHDVASTAMLAARDQAATHHQESARLKDAVPVLERRIATLQREQAIAEERGAGASRRHAELCERRRALQQACSAARARLDTLGEAQDRAAALLEDLQAQFAARAQAAEQVLATRRSAAAEVEVARAEMARAAAVLGKCEAQHVALGEQVAACAAEVERSELDVDQMEASLAAEHGRVTATEAVLLTTNEDLRRQEAVLQTQEEAARAAREACHASADAVAAARRRYADLEVRHESLARSVEAHEGAYPAVRAALQWASRQGQTDFRLVSSIITVPQHLETAVEVALGARVQQIVVDRWQAAEAAVAELKRTGSGRATFLPLDTLRSARRVAPPRGGWQGGILGSAVEMIGYDERYTRVVDNLLGRTVIAENLAAARAALPVLDAGVQIVTLAGEQVAASGALTGGSARGDGGILRREREYRGLPEQIRALQNEIDALEAAAASRDQFLGEVLSTVRTAEVALRAARAQRDRAQADHDRACRDARRAEGDRAVARRRLERASAEYDLARERRQSSADELQAAQLAVGTARTSLAGAEARLAERQQAAQGDETALQELRAALASADGDRRAHAGAYAQQERAVAELAREADMLAATISQSVSDVDELKRQSARLGEQAAAVLEELREARAALDAAEAAAREAQSGRDIAEAAERAAHAAMLEQEQAAARALLALERARAEWDALWERAAADDVDLDQVAADTSGASSIVVPAERIAEVRGRLRRLGPVNALAPDEYATLQERHAFLQSQRADVRAAVVLLQDAIADLDRYMDDQFRTTFAGIAEEFSAAFARLFGGGSAELTLVGGADGRPGGVEIVAQPPGKRRLHLQLLSGGERALTGAALVFAILRHQPRPFCVLDEVDAALDEANVVRFREALLELAGETQFIVVTHNRGTVEAASTLYGVTMGADGMSRVLSLRLEAQGDDLIEATVDAAEHG